jgi:hypothetical protein
LLPANAGQLLREQAMANLRRLRIQTGFDYAGIEIHGCAVNSVPGLDVAGVRERIPTGQVGDTRIIVSETPVADGVPDANYGLVLTISRGNNFSWNSGLATLAADVRVSGEQAGMQLSAVVLDVFQELMVANCASIQAVLRKFLARGGTQADFYRAKADFAADLLARGEAATLFEQYAPDRYACFATLARTDMYSTMDEDERARFAWLWSRFLSNRLADSFLNIDEAVKLVRAGPFRKARPELTPGGGVRPAARVQYGFIDETDLRQVLGDRQTVLQTGAYILSILTSNPSNADTGQIGNAFGWRRRGAPRRLRLDTEVGYKEMVPFVRKGLVTPVRLFLKAN